MKRSSAFVNLCTLIVATTMASMSFAQGSVETIRLFDPVADPDAKSNSVAGGPTVDATPQSNSSYDAGALPGVPSGTTTSYIPFLTIPGGTQIGVSANVDTSGITPMVNGGGIGISTPMTRDLSIGAGVSTTPLGKSVGVGVSLSF